MATADLAEDSRDVGVGDTPQEAVRDARANDREWTWYLASDGMDLYALLCGASEAPADRWLSVARSMERRPVTQHAAAF